MPRKIGSKWVSRVYLTPSLRPKKTFTTKAAAAAWESHIKEQYRVDPAALVRKKDSRTLLDLVDCWYSLHGINLKDGHRRRVTLDNLARELGNPLARQFNGKTFNNWRANSIKRHSPATANRKHSYLKALFNELIRLGEWELSNPLQGIRQFSIDESELAFLTPEQVRDLLAECGRGHNPNTKLVAMVCLATGARWSEAETLKRSQLINARLTFTGTKSGKSRTVPISPQLASALENHPGHGPRFFGPCYDSFGHAVRRAGIELPRGQLSHVLRHTFASHYIQHATRSDALLSLQRILGHSDIKLTLRYAHLAPDHLNEVIGLNPLGTFWDT